MSAPRHDDVWVWISIVTIDALPAIDVLAFDAGHVADAGPVDDAGIDAPITRDAP